ELGAGVATENANVPSDKSPVAAATPSMRDAPKSEVGERARPSESTGDQRKTLAPAQPDKEGARRYVEKALPREEAARPPGEVPRPSADTIATPRDELARHSRVEGGNEMKQQDAGESRS